MTRPWLALLVVGCDPLFSRPGADLAVRVVEIDGGDAAVMDQRVAPVPITFEVDGCDAFEVSVGTRNTAGDTFHVAEHRTDGDRFVLDAPVAWLVSDPDSCGYDRDEPREDYARVAVTCASDGRRVESEDFDVAWVPAAVQGLGRTEVDHLLDGGAPGLVLAIGGGYASVTDLDGESTVSNVAVDASWRPLVAHGPAGSWLWAGCPLPDCGIASIGDGVYSEANYLYAMDETGLDLEAVLVAGSGRELVVEDGEALLLSTLTSKVLVTRVSGQTVRSVQVYEDVELASSGLVRLDSGELGFLALASDGGGELTVFDVDGATVWQGPAPGSGTVHAAALSPDGSGVVVASDGVLWVGPRDAPIEVPSDLVAFADPTTIDVAWGGPDVAVAWREDAVEGLGLDGAVRYRYEVDPTDPERSLPSIRGLHPDDGHLVLDTYSGVRILDAETGALLGGLDPNPCADTPSARAFPVADGEVAIGYGNQIFLLDPSTMGAP